MSKSLFAFCRVSTISGAGEALFVGIKHKHLLRVQLQANGFTHAVA
jgi:hypothetical protein